MRFKKRKNIKLSINFKPLKTYLVTLCECLGTENNAKHLEYELRANKSDVSIANLSFSDKRVVKFFLKTLPPLLGEKPFSSTSYNFFFNSIFQKSKTSKPFNILFDNKRNLAGIGRTMQDLYTVLLKVKRAYKKKSVYEHESIINKLLECETLSELEAWIKEYNGVERIEVKESASLPNANEDDETTSSKKKKKSLRFSMPSKKNSNSQGSDNSHSSQEDQETLKKHGLFQSKTARGSNEV